MNRMLMLSSLVHLLALAGLTMANMTWFRPGYYTGQRVYRVNLVSLPPGGGPTRGTPPASLQPRSADDLTAPEEPGEPPAKVVSRKEAAKPVKSGGLAMERLPKLTSKKQSARPAGQGTGTPGMAGAGSAGTGQARPQGGPGGASFGTGTEGVRLDIENFEFPYYLDAIQRKIQQNLFSPRLDGVRQLQTVVYFRIARNGHVHDLTIERPSGVLLFDNAALRALKTADPLPPLPDGYVEDYLGVHFVFEYVR